MTKYFFKCPYCGHVDERIYVANPFENELFLCLEGERLSYDVISDNPFTNIYCLECNSPLDKVLVVDEKGEEKGVLTRKEIGELFFKLFGTKPLDIEVYLEKKLKGN